MNRGGWVRAVTKKCISAADVDRLYENEDLGRRFDALAKSLDGGWKLIFRSWKHCGPNLTRLERSLLTQSGIRRRNHFCCYQAKAVADNGAGQFRRKP